MGYKGVFSKAAEEVILHLYFKQVEVNTEVVPEESKHTLQKGIQQQHFNEENKESVDLLLEQEIFSGKFGLQYKDGSEPQHFLGPVPCCLQLRKARHSIY